MGAKKSTPAMLLVSVPYGLMLMGGGVTGFVNGSVASLFMGAIAGGLKLLLASGYWTEWRQSPRVRPLWSWTSAALAFGVAGLMGTRYLSAGKFVPQGLMAAVSAACGLVYIVLGLDPMRRWKK